MKLIIDDAHIDQIKKIYKYYPVDGVTTNPTILAANGRKPYDVLKEIREFIGADAELHVQVVAKTADDMVADAHRIQAELGKNTYVKIPSIEEGFRAMKLLKAEGANITATAIYTPMQAFLAAKAGASYAAPYINRIDNMGYDGVSIAQHIHDIFRNNKLNADVLAASFKNSQQLLELAEYGIGAATASPDVILSLVKNDAITSAVNAFIRDFEKLCGEGTTMKDC
ncbi:MAG: fructose-6-phosphate aldolase [Selenomonadaceae bacterium]|nr:fructose-6-phosphate aldolase [Selenomonadaceae bacterium]MBQ7493816.1 fructose-6-phosphate aldolase [Selenomonadaceae bacterium]